MPDVREAPCDLCRTLTPPALLRPEVYQEWDALCPACWSKATAHTALEWARDDARRAFEGKGDVCA